MFFKKKKPKLDSKVRFQHKQFATKLSSARSYRRQARAVPESSLDRLFAQIGLRSRWSQALAGLALAAILYLLYIPNFLSLQTINIVGLSESQARDLEIAIRDEIGSAPFYNPQRNLVFLNNQLIDYAALRVPSVYEIKMVKKDFANQSIYIEAESKYEKYLVATPEKVYDVYNDGTLKKESGLRRDQWPDLVNPNMIKVLLHQNINAEENRLFFHWDLFDKIIQLSELIKSVEGQELAYVTFKEPQAEPIKEELKPVVAEEELAAEAPAEEPKVEEPALEPELKPLPSLDLPINSSEVHMVFYKNNDRRLTYEVIFDTTRDAADSVNDLKLLLSQTNPDRYNQLAYIDLRLETKAFVCLVNSPCSK